MDADPRPPETGQLLRLLPGIYQEQPTVERFLGVLETLLLDERRTREHRRAYRRLPK